MGKDIYVVGQKNGMWKFSDGTWLPVVRGGDGSDGGDGGDGGGEDGGQSQSQDSNKTFSQDDITRIATREKQQGHDAGRKAILAELGIDDPKKAKELIERARKAEEDSLSETEKARKEAEDERNKAREEREEAQRTKLASLIERALLRNGLSLDEDEKKAESQLARAVRLLDLDLDADQDAVNSAVVELKADMPALFTPTNSSDDKKPPRSDPGRPPRNNQGQVSSKDKASEVLRKRHPKLAENKS